MVGGDTPPAVRFRDLFEFGVGNLASFGDQVTRARIQSKKGPAVADVGCMMMASFSQRPSTFVLSTVRSLLRE